MLTNLVLVVGLLFKLTTLTFACQVKFTANSESFACVCNEANCDPIVTQPHSLANHLTVFQTDKLSYRFAKSIIHLDDLVTLNSDIKYVDIHIKINSTDRKQKVIGFGGAFTDSSGININKLPANLADKLMEDYFGPDGLQFTVARVPIGGSDFSDRPYSYDDVEDDFELKHFELANDDYQYKMKYIKKAMNLSSELKLFASPWSSPTWLKTSGKFNGLGILKGEPGSKYWKTWANYLVKFFEAYEQNGIEFWGFTPENEPNVGLNPNWRWNALGFSGQMMRDWIKTDLGPALSEAGFGKDKLKMMIYDDNLGAILNFVRVVLSDQEAAQYVSGIAYHWYSRKYHEVLSEIHELYPDYFMLSTEACEGFTSNSDHVTFGNWTRAENIAADIIDGLNNWSTGWVDWNIALDETGGPNWAGNWVDCPIIVNDTTPEYYKQPMFYTLGHFSKFIGPGSVRVGQSIDEILDESVKITSFLSPSNELVFTILNKKETPINVLIDDLISKPFTMTFEARSLTTLIKNYD